MWLDVKEYCIQTSRDCLLKQARSQFFSLEIERGHLFQRGEFHISHDAPLHSILSSFRTGVSHLQTADCRQSAVCSLQSAVCKCHTPQIERTWCCQFNRDVTVEQQWKATCFADKLSVSLLCRSNYNFLITIPNISLVNSKKVFWPPIVS